MNRDAGKTYLDYVDADQVVHIDTHHKPGEINPLYVARAIFYLGKLLLGTKPSTAVCRR